MPGLSLVPAFAGDAPLERDFLYFNHDGHSDLLLRSTTGALAEWQMDGDHVVASQGIGSVSTDWHLT